MSARTCEHIRPADLQRDAREGGVWAALRQCAAAGEGKLLRAVPRAVRGKYLQF